MRSPKKGSWERVDSSAGKKGSSETVKSMDIEEVEGLAERMSW